MVTSGFSAVFPAGLPVGSVVADGKKHQENFFTLKIKLFSDFTSLSNVQVIQNDRREELKSLQAGEDEAEKNANPASM